MDMDVGNVRVSKTKKFAKKLLVSLLTAAVLTAAVWLGLLYRADNAVADALYQRSKALDGNIFIIGIDAKALEELGPYQTWTRDYVAEAIDILNADPDNLPAAIGVDILYVGYTEESSDTYLAEAAGAWGNVVTAEAAIVGSELVVNEDGSFYMDNYSTLSVDEPFPELREATVQGHINSMYDADGVLRHSILYMKDARGELMPSFALSLYKMYAERRGLEQEPEVPVDGRYNWYVDFSGKPGDYYDGFSIADLLNGDLDTEMFAGSVVLIGPYAAGLQDSFITAADRAVQMYGVEYQANVLSALIRGDFKREVGNTPQLILLFAVCAGCALLFYKRRVLVCTGVWAVFTGGWTGISVLLYKLGYVAHPLWIPAMTTVVYVGSVAVNYVRAAMEKRRVTKTFGRYVDPSIIRELLREDSDSLGLGGKLVNIAVLFVDIRGFTAMSEVLTPGQVVEILNRYLSLTTECVMKNHGTLDKFVGDCTMAIWNAPLKQDDYVYKACLAALDMVTGAEKLSRELLEEFGRTVGFGVGVHCGEAVVGNIGALMRMDYTAIGDTVNTASRLESNAPAGCIYISRAVADALKGRIKTTSLGAAIKLKNKADGFEILTLDGLADAADTQKNTSSAGATV